MKILVTGGAGFIGSNFVRWLHDADKSIHITNLDALTYSGNLENIKDLLASPRHTFVKGNICDSQETDDLIKNAHAMDHRAGVWMGRNQRPIRRSLYFGPDNE